MGIRTIWRSSMVSPWIPRSADDFCLGFQHGCGAYPHRSKAEEMARLGRLERPTSGSGDQRSIQLSYRRAVCAHAKSGAAHQPHEYLHCNAIPGRLPEAKRQQDARLEPDFAAETPVSVIPGEAKGSQVKMLEKFRNLPSRRFWS